MLALKELDEQIMFSTLKELAASREVVMAVSDRTG